MADLTRESKRFKLPIKSRSPGTLHIGTSLDYGVYILPLYCLGTANISHMLYVRMAVRGGGPRTVAGALGFCSGVGSVM